MTLQANYIKHKLNFKFEAGTSRGVLTHKNIWYIRLWDSANSSLIGIGECAPLKGLSPDDRPDFEKKLQIVCATIVEVSITDFSIPQLINFFDLNEYPSIVFGLETAILDLKNGGKREIISSKFYSNSKPIPINGLVWMGDESFMKNQLEEKLAQGYSCIKLKIGAIDFAKELKLIESIRKNYSTEQITIRLDANGGFSFNEAKEKLQLLSNFEIHSIEQPIKAGQWQEMTELCASSPIPIALDEELIGIKSKEEKVRLLSHIKPQFIILKPTLVGGLAMSKEWIDIADSPSIGWWITSALESNIGLNAISQLASSLNVTMPQGLGTGQLYHNNIDSPLTIDKGYLYYDQHKEWDLRIF